ncbi:MAG: hypothetical protein GX585_03165, partial [Clostridiales bacterium]|nr:hypothetical protein [Clostridiales bacterium]
MRGRAAALLLCLSLLLCGCGASGGGDLPPAPSAPPVESAVPGGGEALFSPAPTAETPAAEGETAPAPSPSPSPPAGEEREEHTCTL